MTEPRTPGQGEALVTHRHRAPPVTVTEVEGQSLEAPAEARVLALGEAMLMVEVVMPAGCGSPSHVHAHESVGYVVRGRVAVEVDGVEHELGPGDGFRHPPGAVHTMRALDQEAVWIEIKSPPEPTW